MAVFVAEFNPSLAHCTGRFRLRVIGYAELQALERKPMTMRDWITKLDEFLKISGRKLLDHAGAISHEQAVKKAELEFSNFRALEDAKPSPVEKDFEAAVKKLKQLKPARKKKPA